METKYKETYAFTWKDITIWVKIDYRNNKISIVEPQIPEYCSFKKKDFTFIGRGVEYMNGWKLILQALDKAIDSAKVKYEHYLAETSKFKEDKIIKVAKELNKKIK
jgi:hypothetical protein